ncbi:MAG: HAD hydrolase family protein [Lachnospiraceae bacterium]|nr:HAD hydrolase family protein [Lachnospiraceae bacterium]
MDLVRFCDLDGTIIQSHRICPENGVLVELYNDKPLSYMDYRAYERLQDIPKNLFIPVTSRTMEQYRRIFLYRDGGFPKYALLDNGGILLVNGEEDVQWNKEIKQYISSDLHRYEEILNHITEYGECKVQDDLVIFVKPYSDRDDALLGDYMRKWKGMQMFRHGSKVYICPDRLTKGYAVGKFIRNYSVKNAIAAGDSAVDITMIEAVSHGFYPPELRESVSGKYLDKVSFVAQMRLAESVLNYTVSSGV